MDITPEAVTEQQWARVRLVDTAAPDAPKCQDSECDRPATLHFRAEYSQVGIIIEDWPDAMPDFESGEIRVYEQAVDTFACMGHAGMAAFGAAYAMVVGPTGGG